MVFCDLVNFAIHPKSIQQRFQKPIMYTVKIIGYKLHHIVNTSPNNAAVSTLPFLKLGFQLYDFLSGCKNQTPNSVLYLFGIPVLIAVLFISPVQLYSFGSQFIESSSL